MSSAGGGDGSTPLQPSDANFATTGLARWTGRAGRQRPSWDGGGLTDGEIVESLRETGFDSNSALWRALAKALVEYGYAVLVGWGVAGKLAGKVAKYGGRGRGRVPHELRLDADDARALAAEVLMASVEPFRMKSLPDWSPDGGASLRTFFIRRCLFEFADVYEKWERQQRNALATDVAWIDDGRHGARPDEEAEARVMLDQLLEGDPVLRRILELQDAGYTLDEIAEKLAVSASAVKTRTFRFRKRTTTGEGLDD